jgi:hypothetical protein
MLDNDISSYEYNIDEAISSNSVAVSQENKKKRTRIDSRGSNHNLREQSRHLKIEKDRFKLDFEEIKNIQSKRTEEHYREILSKLEKKCVWEKSGCCIFKKFTTDGGKCDYNAVFSKIEECQEIVMLKKDNSFLHVSIHKNYV